MQHENPQDEPQHQRHSQPPPPSTSPAGPPEVPPTVPTVRPHERAADREPIPPERRRPRRLGSRGFRSACKPEFEPEGVDRLGNFLRLPTGAIVFPYTFANGGKRHGKARWETAVLSCFAWYWRVSKGRKETLAYHDGAEIEIGEDEFVLSVQTVAETLWQRFYRARVPSAGQDDNAFHTFYKGVQRATSRLQGKQVGGVPLLSNLGPARTDVPGKAKDLYGARWSMLGSAVDQHLETLSPCSSPTVTFDSRVPDAGASRPCNSDGGRRPRRSGGDAFGDTSYVDTATEGGAISDSDGSDSTDVVIDVAAVYDHLVADTEDVRTGFVEAGAKSGGLRRRERPAASVDWQRRRARTAGQSAHVTIGAWAQGEATVPDRRDRACMTPYLVADIDAPTVETSAAYARLLIERLEGLGVNAGDLVVSYTGNRGFHVRIPHGLVGRPLWPRAADVQPVLAAFFKRVCGDAEGPCGPLYDVIDGGLFSPMHLVRAIGSEHEKVPGRCCVGYDGGAFAGLIDWYGELALDIVENNSERYVPYAIPHPDRFDPNLTLVSLLQEAVEEARSTRSVHRARGGSWGGENEGVIDRIREGVRPGEEFAPGYVGREMAFLLYADYLLTHGGLSEEQAWAELQRWNEEQNPVPIGTFVEDRESRLEYVFRRACAYTAGTAGTANPKPEKTGRYA